VPFKKPTSHFRVGLFRNLFLYHLESLQFSFDRGSIWKGFASWVHTWRETRVKPTRALLVGFQQILQYRARLLKEAELSQSFTLAEFGLDVIRVLRKDLSKRGN
jgi:hypothetical protein